MKPLDLFYDQLPEPHKSYLLGLSDLIRDFEPEISEKWAYGMPFFCYRGKRFCYIWFHKKYQKPYLGIVDGKWVDFPGLISEERKRMKILLLDSQTDIPVKLINQLLKKLISLYR